MAILSWDKPERAISVDAWKGLLADSAPPGVYMPNMSRKDMEKWKAKLCGHTKGQARVEIRKSWGGAQVLIIVSLTGTEYPDKYGKVGQKDVNVEISQNGRIYAAFEEMEQLTQAVAEAKALLEGLAKGEPDARPRKTR